MSVRDYESMIFGAGNDWRWDRYNVGWKEMGTIGSSATTQAQAVSVYDATITSLRSEGDLYKYRLRNGTVVLKESPPSIAVFRAAYKPTGGSYGSYGVLRKTVDEAKADAETIGKNYTSGTIVVLNYLENTVIWTKDIVSGSQSGTGTGYKAYWWDGVSISTKYLIGEYTYQDTAIETATVALNQHGKGVAYVDGPSGSQVWSKNYTAPPRYYAYWWTKTSESILSLGSSDSLDAMKEHASLTLAAKNAGQVYVTDAAGKWLWYKDYVAPTVNYTAWWWEKTDQSIENIGEYPSQKEAEDSATLRLNEKASGQAYVTDPGGKWVWSKDAVAVKPDDGQDIPAGYQRCPNGTIIPVSRSCGPIGDVGGLLSGNVLPMILIGVAGIAAVGVAAVALIGKKKGATLNE